MYFPAVHDERTTLVNYLEQQLNAVRDASHGLTEEQARSRPLPSELSLAGLLKHVAWCMSGALAGAGHEPDPDLDLGDFYGTFALAADESLERMREIYARLCERYLDMVGSADLDATMPMGPFPWYGVTQPSEGALRYLVVHQIEEFARHAGHADLLREAIDGAKAAELNAAVEGRPANDFVTPWAPAT